MKRKTPRIHYAWVIMIGCCFMQAGGLGAVMDAAGVFFVPVCEDLGILRSELSMYMTFYFLATIVAMPIVGKWITKYNLNVLLSIAFALVVVAMALMGTYTQPWQWWISGTIYGLAGSFIFVVPAPVLIANWFKKRKGLALGIAMSFSGIGGAILSPVFTLFIQEFGWRDAYFIAAIIIAVLVLPWTMFVFKLHPSDLGLQPYGWTPEDDRIEEERTKDRSGLPGVPAKGVVKTVSFVCLFLFAGLMAYFAGFNTHLPGFAQSLGYSAMIGSSLLTAVMFGNVVEKLAMGWLNDKIGVQRTVIVQLVMVAVGFVGFIFAGKNLILLYISAFFFGAQNSLVAVSTPLLIRQIFGDRDFPVIFTYARIGTGAIGCLGPVTVGAIFDTTGSFIPAFMLGIVVAVLGFVVVRLAYINRKNLTWIGAKESG